jgi:hypothetical protein
MYPGLWDTRYKEFLHNLRMREKVFVAIIVRVFHASSTEKNRNLL